MAFDKYLVGTVRVLCLKSFSRPWIQFTLSTSVDGGSSQICGVIALLFVVAIRRLPQEFVLDLRCCSWQMKIQ
jgi:hypothetical protein